MTTNPTHTPKLRFSEFIEPWKNVALGEIATFSKGKGISKSDIDPDGQTYCVRYGELYTSYDTIIDEPLSRTSVDPESLVLSEGGEVIVPASGETAEDIATAAVVIRPGVALGGDLNIIQSHSDGGFLASYLSGKKRMTLASMAQGNSVVHLYPTQLSTLRIGLPTHSEQSKIAAFLESVDKKITQISKKKALLEDYKKGCMQQLLSQAIRFKDDNGKDFPNWEERQLGEIATTFSGGTPLSSNRSYYEGHIPFIGSGDIASTYVGQRISEEALAASSAKLVSAGDLLYALYGATSGEVAISRISGAINQAVLCIRPTENPLFLFHWLRHSKEKITATYLQGGQGNLSGNIVKSLRIPLPHPDEQRKIADFLTTLDTKIHLISEELELAQTFKKGLLQQMFV